MYQGKEKLPKDMLLILITMFRAVIRMKKATERRRNILDLLIKSHEPISTTYLMEVFQVTKPVIDEDIRVLKDVGYNIVGIPGHHGGYQLYDYEGATKMVLDSERAKRFEDICGKLPEEEKHILSYVMHLAELGNIV